MAVIVGGDGAGGVNFNNLDLGSLLDGVYVQKTSTFASFANGPWTDNFYGVGFQYNAQAIPSGGTITRYQELYNGQLVFDITGVSVPVTTLVTWAMNNANALALETILSGADSIQGSNFADILGGLAGADTIMAGNGNDAILESSGANYLRGDAGNDVIQGGMDFDDINGNMGNDTAAGGLGNDWVVGGKDHDILGGEAGNDIVYGNLGDDFCSGGAGADTIRGGQDQDTLFGQEGDDWMSGDRGSDTVSGGFGADTFHSFSEAGLDHIVDFTRADGDRILLDAGTTYTASQSGADTVIDMGGGNRVVLQNVQLSTLTGDWIIVG